VTPGNPARYWTGYNYMNASEGFPAIKPPFWVLTAYNLNEGKLKWQFPIGEVPELVARGIRNTGSIPTRGGPIVTAGGLIFAPSQSDKKIYAYDAETGRTLWARELVRRAGGRARRLRREWKAVPGSLRTGYGRAASTAGAACATSGPEQKGCAGYYTFALPPK
jgi:quinoprotein glucose dehydrogenase